MPGLSDLLVNSASSALTDTTTSGAHHTSFGVNPSQMEFREFYAAACPHCVHLKPAWEQAVADYAKTGGKVHWRQIECNDNHWAPVPANEKLCKNIEGFPTMKLFDLSSGDDDNATEIAEYRGPRDAKSLVDWVQEQSGDAAAKGEEETATANIGVAGAVGTYMAGLMLKFWGTEDSEEKKTSCSDVGGVPRMFSQDASSSSTSFM